MSFSTGSKETTQTQSSQTEPWKKSIPYLTSFLNQLGKAEKGQGRYAPNAAESEAFDQLRANAEAGNPYADQIGTLANDLFATQSYTPQVQQGYADLERRLSATADGSNLNIDNNPYIQDMLKRVTDDAVTRVNSGFAAAGRDFSGYNQKALGEGITNAQLPVLADLYSREQGRTDAAARDLYAARTGSATQSADLDRIATGLRSAGIDVSGAALNAQNWGPQQILALENQLKNLPYDELDRIAALLFPAAGLGSQSQGTGTSETSQSGFGFGIGDVGKIATAIAGLSDERAKTDISRIGAMEDGTPLYRYRYKGYPFWHIGVLAQEVEKTNPDAVRMIEGVRFVDILKATAKSAAMLEDAKP